MDDSDNLFHRRMDVGDDPGFTSSIIVGKSGRLQLDCQGGDIQSRAGQREYHKHRYRIVTFSGVSDQPWLAISSASGTAPATVQILPSTNGLAAGTYTGYVRLTFGATTKTVTVVLTMTSPAPVQHTVSLSWQVPTGKVISYSMYRSQIKGGSYGMVASAIGGNSYIDQSVQSGTPYYYVVTAVDP